MKIYYLNTVTRRSDATDSNGTLAVFSSKKKAEKYFQNLMDSYEKQGIELKIEASTNRHYLENEKRIIYWYITEGILDKKWDGKPIIDKRDWL